MLQKNFSPLLAGKYRKSTMSSTWWCHRPNEGKSGLEPERVRALWTLPSLASKKTLAAEKWQETHFLSNEEKENWIEDYVEKETAGARQWVQDAEAASRQELEDMETAETTASMTTEPK